MIEGFETADRSSGRVGGWSTAPTEALIMLPKGRGEGMGSNDLVQTGECNHKGCKFWGTWKLSKETLPHQHPQLRAWWARWGRGRLAVPLWHGLSQNTGLRFFSLSFLIHDMELCMALSPTHERADCALLHLLSWETLHPPGTSRAPWLGLETAGFW